MLSKQKSSELDGKAVFELYDTYGFPVDLTQLILEERGGRVDKEGFRAAMEKQRERARSAGKMQMEDWVEFEGDSETEFIGYDRLSSSARLLRFRKVTVGRRSHVQMVFDRTPFYAEGGGQVGDQGWLTAPDGRVIKVFDCRKETGLHVHLAEECGPTSGDWNLEVDRGRRASTQANHSATHLLHKALRDELGEHVEQKGSLVAPDHLRFDFSHYSKLEREQIGRIEERVNEEIWKNVALNEFRSIPIDEALKKGAMALFGENMGKRFARSNSETPWNSVVEPMSPRPGPSVSSVLWRNPLWPVAFAGSRQSVLWAPTSAVVRNAKYLNGSRRT